MAQFKNYINGEWVDAQSGEEYERRNPATGELIGTFAKSGPLRRKLPLTAGARLRRPSGARSSSGSGRC